MGTVYNTNLYFVVLHFWHAITMKCQFNYQFLSYLTPYVNKVYAIHGARISLQYQAYLPSAENILDIWEPYFRYQLVDVPGPLLLTSINFNPSMDM